MTNYSLRGCESKRKYTSRQQARKAAKRLEQSEHGERHVSAYRCGLCHNYHIGHNDVHRVGSAWDYIPGRELNLTRSVA